MICKKCDHNIIDQANFCPYCGNKIESTTKDPFENYRLNNNTNKISNTKIEYKDDFEKKEPPKKNNNSLIGLIIAISAIPLCFQNYVGLLLAFIALIFTIIGYKHANKTLAISSLIISILSFIISIILSFIILLASFTITFSNNYKTNAKQFFTDIFYNSIYQKELNDLWYNDDYILSLNDDYYYLYTDINNIENNYYYGTFSLEEGYQLSTDEYLYADDDYYYYLLQTKNNKSKIDGIYNDKTLDILEEMVILKLDKTSRRTLVLENKLTLEELTLKKN